MIVAQPLKFDTSDKVAFGYKINIKSNFFIGMYCMNKIYQHWKINQHWKAKNLLFATMCCNINLLKPFGNYALLNTRNTAKNLIELRSRHVAVI